MSHKESAKLILQMAASGNVTRRPQEGSHYVA